MQISKLFPIFAVQTTTKNNKTMNVYLLHCSWNVKGDDGHDVLKVFSTKESAECFLAELVKKEKKDTWIADYWDDVSDSPDCENWDTNYEEREDYFFYEVNYGEYYTEIWIEKQEVL